LQEITLFHLGIGFHVLQELPQQGGGEGEVCNPELLQTLQPAYGTDTSKRVIFYYIK
jgi:hypothetical protein